MNPAWTEEKVLELIRTSSGTHLDPQVVEYSCRFPKNLRHPPNGGDKIPLSMDVAGGVLVI